MLVFSTSQMSDLKHVWLLDGLKAQLPAMIEEFSQQHPDYLADNAARLNRGFELIDQSAVLEFDRIDHIRELLAIESDHGESILNQNAVRHLYSARLVCPVDRLKALAFVCALEDKVETNDPYRPLHLYPRLQRCRDIAAQLKRADDLIEQRQLNVLRHGFYHAIVGARLVEERDWQPWHSDFENAFLGIEQLTFGRRLLLQPSVDFEVHASIDAQGDIAILNIEVPDDLSLLQHGHCDMLIDSWVRDLQSVDFLRGQIASLTDSEEAGGSHAQSG